MASFIFILDRQMLEASLQSLGAHEVECPYAVGLAIMEMKKRKKNQSKKISKVIK